MTNGKMHVSCSPSCVCKYRECPVQRQEVVRNPSPSMAALIGSPGSVPELAAFVSCRAETRGADPSGMPGSVKGDSEPFLAPPPCRARSCPGQKAPFHRPPFSFFPGPNAMISWWYKSQSKGWVPVPWRAWGNLCSEEPLGGPESSPCTFGEGVTTRTHTHSYPALANLDPPG